MSNYPNISEAIALWQESLSGVIKHAKANIQMEYIFHSTGVAESAYKIALKCGLDAQKAYIAGSRSLRIRCDTLPSIKSLTEAPAPPA